MAIPSFVDQVTLHVYGGNGGHGWPRSTARSSSPWADPTAATAVTAARSSCASSPG